MKPFVTTTELLPHQVLPVNKLLPIKVGALFMDMGTGKSRTVIEFVSKRHKKIDRVVWFCPVSSKKDTVYYQILEHTDCQDIYIFDGNTTEDNIPDVRWYIVGIESMSSSARVVLTVLKLITKDTFVILDESSYIKGHRSRRAQRTTFLAEKAKYRMILTGTPISQGVVDLYAQMKFLSPKILGYSSFYSFAANHLEYSEKYPGLIVRAHNTEWLAAKIKPYVYQITKAECFSLPNKLYETRYFHMTKEQHSAYCEAKNEILSLVDDEDFDSYAIFRLYGILQQIVSGFWNRRMTGNRLAGADKFKMFEFKHKRLEMLNDAIIDVPEDNKIIIWAKFRYDVKQIRKTLVEQYGRDSIALYHGGIAERSRSAELQNFRRNARFLVATQSAGGYTLTLNEANYVIFYNNGFKYLERIQAEDRCHRYGQKHRVTYIDIHCAGSIDDRIWQSLSKKQNVASEFRREVDKIKNNKVKLKELIKNL
ncbi:MAG: SNF2-related protein [bacterium]